MLKPTSRFLDHLALQGPTLLIDEARARSNIRAMAGRARVAAADFRPHFKTHQSVDIGRWFAAEGVTRITVSSTTMAEKFAASGWDDITLAFLLNPRELPRLTELAHTLHRRGGRLGLTVDAPAAARALAAVDDLPAAVWIKVDTGYGRTGVLWNRPEDLREVQTALGDRLELVGLLTHSGHTYGERGTAAVTEIFTETVARMRQTRAALEDSTAILISVGDTPSCSLTDDLSGVDEIRPGNFIFYDLMQREIGSCRDDQLAAAMACPVVGIYPERGQIVLQGGAVHLAKESLEISSGLRIYGFLGTIAAGEQPALGQVIQDAPLVALTQEHAIVQASAGSFSRLCGDLVIGDQVLVWPVHSCLTCDLQPVLHTLTGVALNGPRAEASP